uniref:MGAT4 conserved region domain-containing protein n=1 Tax=Catagonus wagneri TaxID=51154 RepID=A0A8C3WCL1_9CETA
NNNNNKAVIKENHFTIPVQRGALPEKGTLLTVGISSTQRPQGARLLDTLQLLFQAHPQPELECIVVLVCLSSSDPEWLSQTAANISDLFRAHVEAQRLLVVHGHLGGPPLPEDREAVYPPSPCEGLYKQQKKDFALLMNFATNFSEYFLLLEDQVYPISKFISTIHWALLAWKNLPWVILDFSSLSLSGKVFHSHDLPRLTSLFLLFQKDTPTHLLLSEFCLLLAQNTPIQFSASLFDQKKSELEDLCFPGKKRIFGEPDNPTASVVTDMMSVSDSVPQYAYTLNSDSYPTLNPMRGNHLTVILERPQKVIRIEVLTGSDKPRQYHLERGQVELGFDPLEDFKGCARYTLLGPLVDGHLDQIVSYEEDSMERLSCIRLLVLAPQESWLLIRQIKVWTSESEEEKM